VDNDRKRSEPEEKGMRTAAPSGAQGGALSRLRKDKLDDLLDDLNPPPSTGAREEHAGALAQSMTINLDIDALPPEEIQRVYEHPGKALPVPAAPPPNSGMMHPGGWMEDMRTTLWETQQDPRPGRDTLPMGSMSKELEAPHVVTPLRSVGSTSSKARPSPVERSQSREVARVAEPIVEAGSEPYYHDRPPTSPPLMIEAPSRIVSHRVDRISPEPKLWLITEPASVAAEQYRITALKLKEGRELRVVAVVAPTAAVHGSLVASNVALALSEGNRAKVLLLEANLRQPEIAGFFGVQSEVGLSEQIRQHCRVATDPWSVLAVMGSFHMLPAGVAEKNASALLSSEAIADLMSELRRNFDYVVVSPPPVLDSADINILQDHLDGAILVVKSGLTKKESVTHSISQIGESKIVGVVLVDTKRTSTDP
jgi:protein-tyrosine kinase